MIFHGFFCKATVQFTVSTVKKNASLQTLNHVAQFWDCQVTYLNLPPIIYYLYFGFKKYILRERELVK